MEIMESVAVINVRRFLDEMTKRRLTIAKAAAHCHVSTETVKGILKGKFPLRITSFYSVMEGLEIPITEALLATEGSKVQAIPIAAPEAVLRRLRPPTM